MEESFEDFVARLDSGYEKMNTGRILFDTVTGAVAPFPRDSVSLSPREFWVKGYDESIVRTELMELVNDYIAGAEVIRIRELPEVTTHPGYDIPYCGYARLIAWDRHVSDHSNYLINQTIVTFDKEGNREATLRQIL